jgi:ubiquitin-conjugating enzyme E2 Z
MSSNIISKDTIQRLLKDIKNILKEPKSLTDNGIYYKHDEEDILKGYALIIGPSDTPYFGGYYFFEFNFPYDYPHSPPKVIFSTNGENIRFNPNLYICGKVCVSLLNTWRGDQWTSCQSITSVLLTLCTLLCNNPLLNEPGVNINHKDIIKYNEIIEFSNINIAICDVVNKNSGVLLNKFYIFYDIIKEHFQNNYSKHLEFINKKIIKYNNIIPKITTDFYRLDVVINYEKLLNKLKKTLENIQENIK